MVRVFFLYSANAILRETLQWREVFGVEAFLEDPDPQMVRQCREYRDVFHLDIFGRDDTGHVIMCQAVGTIEPSRLLQSLSMTAIKKHFIRDIEYLCRRKDATSRELGKPRYKHISVVDLTGFGRKHTSGDFRKPMMEVK